MPVKTVWELRHTCGHTRNHDLSNKRPSKRAGYARWLATRTCPTCWHTTRHQEATRTTQRAEQLAETTAWETRAGMPELDGIPKAVEWGRQIRHQLLRAAHENLAMADDVFAGRVEDPARHVRRASWWIDQRGTDPDDLEELVADAAADDMSSTCENPY